MEHHPSAVATADPPIVGPLYTTDEVGKMLRVSQRAVQDWIRSGTLTAVRYGRLLRIRQADLATFGEVLPRRPPRFRHRLLVPVQFHQNMAEAHTCKGVGECHPYREFEGMQPSR